MENEEKNNNNDNNIRVISVGHFEKQCFLFFSMEIATDILRKIIPACRENSQINIGLKSF